MAAVTLQPSRSIALYEIQNLIHFLPFGDYCQPCPLCNYHWYLDPAFASHLPFALAFPKAPAALRSQKKLPAATDKSLEISTKGYASERSLSGDSDNEQIEWVFGRRQQITRAQPETKRDSGRRRLVAVGRLSTAPRLTESGGDLECFSYRA